VQLHDVAIPQDVGGVPVVAAPAEIDVTTAGQLRAVLLEAAIPCFSSLAEALARTLAVAVERG
jgi:hypothetical protein